MPTIREEYALKTEREKLLQIHWLKDTIDYCTTSIDKRLRKIGICTQSKYYESSTHEQASLDSIILGYIEELKDFYGKLEDAESDFKDLTHLFYGHAIDPKEYQIDPKVKINRFSYLPSQRLYYEE